MRLHNWTTAVLTSALLAGLGTAAAAEQTPAEGRQDSLKAEVVERETRSLSLGPNGVLSLTNFTGDITVRTTPGEQVTLTIIRHARGRTEADARLGLERVTVQIDERANRATVESLPGIQRNAPYAVSVAYEVAAPPGTSVNIHSLAGNIDASGLAGELSAVTTTGDIAVRDVEWLSQARSVTGRVALANVRSEGTLEAGTVAGDLHMQGVRVRRLVVSTVSGGVTARDTTAGRAELTSTAGDIEYAGEAAPDGRYELRTHTGDLKFIVLGGSGFELRASTFMGRIAPNPGIGLTVVRKEPRELVGTVGDGRALVTMTSFSGGIIIERR